MPKAKTKPKVQNYNLGPAFEAIRQKRLERESRGEFPAEFMRLSLTEDAYEVVRKMPNAEFREFVSSAIRKAAKRR